MYLIVRTTKEKPEDSSTNLGFDRVKALIRGLLVHVQGYCNVGSLAKAGMGGGIVSLAKVIDGIAVFGGVSRA